LCAQNTVTILDTKVNINEEEGGRGEETEMIVKELRNLHFEDEYDIHTSSIDHEESGYVHDLELVTIFAKYLHVAYPTRSE
jgi:hypothetical protein